MPYIAQEERSHSVENPRTPGELNYAITLKLIHAWNMKCTPLALSAMRGGILHLFAYFWAEKIQNYTTINDIYGALACSIFEWRRRVRPKGFGFEGMARKNLVQALSKVAEQFYIDIVIPYEERKIRENGDVYEAVQRF